jgi:hypothetical protein
MAIAPRRSGISTCLPKPCFDWRRLAAELLDRWMTNCELPQIINEQPPQRSGAPIHQERRMPDEDVQLPLSGNITQSIFPLTINVGRSGDQSIEKDALSIASYGRQLGRIGDALIVLLKHVQLGHLSPDEERAIRKLKAMLNAIADQKEQHGAKHVLRPPP